MSTIKTESNVVNATAAVAAITVATAAAVAGNGPAPVVGGANINAPFSLAGANFQLPVNMSNSAIGNHSTTAATTTTTTTRNNISVTNIKCELVDEMVTNGNIVPVIATNAAAATGLVTGSYYNGASNAASGGGGLGVRIPLTKAEDSDSETELTNIENLKVTRRAASASSMGAHGVSAHGSDSKNGPRPMSWEGELSETETTETELMETENSLSSCAVVAVIKSEATTTTSHHHQHQNQHQQQQQHSFLQGSTQPVSVIKPELEPQISVEIHNPGLYSPHTKLKLPPTQSDPINLKYEPVSQATPPTPSTAVIGEMNSPLLARQKSATLPPLPANPSPDSAIHSVYTHSSPSQSPLTSRHAPYTPSLSRNNSDASHSSCYSYSSEFSPTHSPIQGRHAAGPPPAAGATSTPLYGQFNGSALHHSLLYRPISLEAATNASEAQNLSMDTQSAAGSAGALNLGGSIDGLPTSAAAGISRQQLINSPCPICGDKISGFHYGIFSCESCKGFFKRTVQNRKNYVCVRGGPCAVSISTRKKCPACRFDKCLQKGMKLEAIREDRTRGGRSTYQCTYTLPTSMLSPLLSPATASAEQQQQHGVGAALSQQQQQTTQQRLGGAATPHHGGGNGVLAHGMNGCVAGNNSMHTPGIKTEQSEANEVGNGHSHSHGHNGAAVRANSVPLLMQEIMDVEHLWRFNESELARLNQPLTSGSSTTQTDATTSSTTSSSSSSSSAAPNPPNPATTNQMTNPLLASAGLSSCNGENANPYLIAHLCNVADHRLYKIVKWCKSLPLFKNISIDDQICLLINSWCELLLFSCCFRSIDAPGEIKMSQGKKLNLAQAKLNGIQACIERMLNLTDHLRRLRVDSYEYVTMKVIVLLQSDTSELKEPVKVRECQEQALQCLQTYTLAHYPDTPSKFGELLLRIPELQRTCQLGKEMLTIKSRDGGDFNLLMELLRGEH